MRRKVLSVLLLVAVIALLALVAVYPGGVGSLTREAHEFVAGSTAASRPATAAVVASGSIEAHTVIVGTTAGGRLAQVSVAGGETVAAGDQIAMLDTALLDAQVAQAQAALAQAQAQVALLKAGAAPTDIAVAEAALAQARAGSDAADIGAADATALVTAVGDLDVKIAGATSAVDVAQLQLQAAQANATAADLEADLWARVVKQLEAGVNVALPLPGRPVVHYDSPTNALSQARLQWNLASQQQWQAHSQVGIATAAVATAQQTLADLQTKKADPQALQAQADKATAAAGVAQAQVQAAQANLDLVESGAQPEQIEAAEALARQAASALQAAETYREQAQIVAPVKGVVTSVVHHAGEVVAAGAPIVYLADLSQVTLDVYVPEPELGRVQLGQQVRVMVDSFPGRAFAGTVTQIADQAEFTPKNVETRDQRANTVYKVTITLANPEGSLKPGMPADATFCAIGADTCGAEVTPAKASEDILGRLRRLVGVATPPTTVAPITGAGVVDGTEITIASELKAGVTYVVSAGGKVEAGQVVARLDGSDLEPSYRQALDAVEAAKADLARIIAPPQAARVAQGEAQVAQAQAALRAAQSALDDAKKQRDNPQDLDSQISAAQSQAAAAKAQVDLAQANLKAALVLQESIPEGVGSDQDKTRRAIYDQQVVAATLAEQAAEAQANGAQATLAQLLAIRNQPVALDAAVHQAEGQVAVAKAALATAQATLAQIQAPPRPEAVALAQARVSQAEAAAALIEVTLGKLVVRTPISGTVTSQVVHAGEVALPGASMLTVIDLHQVHLTVYVPEGQLGRVALGQSALVTVDAYPGRVFTGRVTRISDQAEFTPKNVATQDERVKMVFGVEISLDNNDGSLKPGMPGEATLQ